MGNSGALPHCVVKIKDVVLQVPGLGVEQVDEGNGFGVPESLL